MQAHPGILLALQRLRVWRLRRTSRSDFLRQLPRGGWRRIDELAVRTLSRSGFVQDVARLFCRMFCKFAKLPPSGIFLFGWGIEKVTSVEAY